MFDDPTEAITAFIQANARVREGVQAILDHQRAAGVTDSEASEALKTYTLGQMYGSLRQREPFRAAFEEARAARDIDWWRLLFDLGWSSNEVAGDIPW